MKEKTEILYRPTGPHKLELVRASGYRKWPPRLPGQPIFYPVTNQEYASQIAKDWNVRDSGISYVTRFEVRKTFMDKYEIHQVGGNIHTEWWIPAAELEELNSNIIGNIEVVQEFQADNTSIKSYVLSYKEDDVLEIIFNWNNKHAQDFIDHNLTFRREVLRLFDSEPEIFPLELVVALYEAETEFAKEVWGVNRIVSKLASTMLERGRTKYIVDYLKGWRRGMDAYLQSLDIDISQDCVLELVRYLKSTSNENEFLNRDIVDAALEYFERKIPGNFK